jgi:hypothetical protein
MAQKLGVAKKQAQANNNRQQDKIERRKGHHGIMLGAKGVG